MKDASSFMDESNESDQSEIPEDDIKIQKVEVIHYYPFRAQSLNHSDDRISQLVLK